MQTPPETPEPITEPEPVPATPSEPEDPPIPWFAITLAGNLLLQALGANSGKVGANHATVQGDYAVAEIVYEGADVAARVTWSPKRSQIELNKERKQKAEQDLLKAQRNLDGQRVFLSQVQDRPGGVDPGHEKRMQDQIANWEQHIVPPLQQAWDAAKDLPTEIVTHSATLRLADVFQLA